jgi:methylenetetrahydrofolate--tRNA-(uracil-5-)-methyltransferase
VQLRQDNALGTLYNMVGFQTKLKYGAQVEVFRTIPGLEDAQFARLGGLHRNTYLNSPHLLDETLRLKSRPNIRFAGQITGCEGYVESAAIGLLTGLFVADEMAGRSPSMPPETTAFGALLNHITKGHIAYEEDMGKKSFQPMNINFGLFPPVSISKPEGHQGRWRGKEKGAAKKLAVTSRALNDVETWLKQTGTHQPAN